MSQEDDEKQTIGEPGRLDWMPLPILAIDASYQRDAASRRSSALINRIADGFDWSQLQPLVVAERPDGTYFVVDGQHRLAAAEKCGVDKLPCYIVPATALSAEANSFVGINKNRVNITPLQVYHAELAAGDPAAMQVAEIAQEAGVTIPKNPTVVGPQNDRVTPPKVLTCISRLKKCLLTFGADAVKDAMIALVEAGDDHSNYLGASFLEGVVMIYARHGFNGVLDPDRLIETIAERDDDGWKEACQNLRSFEPVNVSAGYAKVIGKAYDKNLREGSRLNM
ncbi:DUF6551 family protein [Kordiimonas marina]|uniref:DUF6551 family protein n=1 Tax=Kordiimonas marina TaxID=2872312 RepID=UPI001FF69F77|nr:DUF6551 family protein [Kordiimonas marina]MCJ9428567.1 ParB N-terminal domain-containing protein [Kordiimonas marina]